MIEFQPVRCRCGAVVLDSYGFRGIVRPVCPSCRHRVTIHGDGHEAVVTQVDEKPKKLPRVKIVA